MTGRDLDKAALRGEASYVWRAGQERRLKLILEAAGPRAGGRVLDNGCGIGAYLAQLAAAAQTAHGLEFDAERAHQAGSSNPNVAQAAGEALPYPAAAFDLVLSHEVLEHVADDRRSVTEIERVLRPGGRLVLFVPNRNYPFETHGIYWGGGYHFGNIPLVNYLPDRWRQRLAPHVRAYRRRQLDDLFDGLALRVIERRILFGAYDNWIARWPRLGRGLRWLFQALERTPLQAFGLSHFWVVEKTDGGSLA